ncbi:DUF2268 domain-containing protein [Bacillus sp. NSP9.1]|uniref:DUF2268 domain-containing protein n=1 Tax=Bacillus sp. NSP9.1 TaxID=1071078 RepID=UPI000417AEE2|nr:DUF2268 domain-containing protein [Bacillus sp. NSP9.1]QHZ46235.1 hypothetical protein M654_007970 [Bacillus sp. NSP9.1]
MSVAKTYEWYEQALSMRELSFFLLPYFKGAPKEKSMSLISHLQSHGMVKNWPEGRDTMKELKKKGVFEQAEKEEQLLKKRWNGPDVPIIILPVDERNRKIRAEFGSKSGLAFHDKLFLFLSAHLSPPAVSAVMTHEYNHVCRLENIAKEEKNMTLLDTIILEGLAENAVYERLGASETAAWTKIYSEKQLAHFQTRLVEPHFELKRHEGRLFSNILFGKGYYPDMLGYAVGYNIVKKYLSKKKLKVADVLSLPSEDFIGLSL